MLGERRQRISTRFETQPDFTFGLASATGPKMQMEYATINDAKTISPPSSISSNIPDINGIPAINGVKDRKCMKSTTKPQKTTQPNKAPNGQSCFLVSWGV
jgi:hypothetical protein